MITVWGTLGKTVGFFIPFVIAALYGLDSRTDALFFAYGLTLFLAAIFSQVIECIIVPYIAESRSRDIEIESFIGQILILGGAGMAILVTGLLLIARPVLTLVTNFDEPTLDLVQLLLMEVSPLVLFATWSSIFAGTLNASKKFNLPAVSPIFRAIVTLIFMFLFMKTMGIHAIAIGYVAGELVRLIILATAVARYRMFRWSFSLKLDRRIQSFAQTASYQMLSMVLVGFNPMIDKTMVSWLGEGAVSILHYADRLYMIPVVFLTGGLVVALLSHWSIRYYETGPDKLKSDLEKTLKYILLFTVPITIILIAMHKPIIHLALARGAFAADRIPDVGWTWVCYLLGYIPYMITTIYVRGLLVFKDTRSLMFGAIYMLSLNIILNLVLMQIWDVKGIALATSIISLFTSFYFRRRFHVQLELQKNRARNA